MIYGQFDNVESDFEMQNMDSIFALGAVNSLHLPRIDQALALIFEQIRQMNRIDKCKIDVKFFCGDTPASQALGGFNWAVGNANYPCRECIIHKSEIGK